MPLNASTSCCWLGNTLYLCLPVQPSQAGALPQNLGPWFWSKNLLLTSGISSVIARWLAGAQTWAQTWNLLPHHQVVKIFSTLKSQNYLCGVWILSRSVENADIEDSNPPFFLIFDINPEHIHLHSILSKFSCLILLSCSWWQTQMYAVHLILHLTRLMPMTQTVKTCILPNIVIAGHNITSSFCAWLSLLGSLYPSFSSWSGCICLFVAITCIPVFTFHNENVPLLSRCALPHSYACTHPSYHTTRNCSIVNIEGHDKVSIPKLAVHKALYYSTKQSLPVAPIKHAFGCFEDESWLQTCCRDQRQCTRSAENIFISGWG